MKAERQPRRSNGFLRFIDGLLSFAFLALILLAAVGTWLRQSADAPGPLTEAALVAIPKGEGAIEIAERLEKSGAIADRRLFMVHYYMARFHGGSSGGGAKADAASLKAGEYQIPQGATVRQVLEIVTSGRGVLLKITIPEGLTSQQIVDRLKAEPGLTGEIAEVPPEGALLPDTYKFSRGADRQEIIDRMRAEQVKLLAALWASRDATLPLKTPEEAVALASIVEKETGRAEERPRVASVFVNRLRKGMRLQSDPTIVYGLVGGQGPLGRPLTRSDIDSKTAYNTYQIDALPPGPICNPGRASLTAALNPPSTSDLYFVADGTGGHVFTSTLKDHNAAVQNWRKIERARQAAGGGDPASAAAPASPAPAAGDAAPVTPPTKGARSPTIVNSGRTPGAEVPPVQRKRPKAPAAASKGQSESKQPAKAPAR